MTLILSYETVNIFQTCDSERCPVVQWEGMQTHNEDSVRHCVVLFLTLTCWPWCHWCDPAGHWISICYQDAISCMWAVIVSYLHSKTDSRGHWSSEEKTPGGGAGAGGEPSDHSTREPGEAARMCVSMCFLCEPQHWTVIQNLIVWSGVDCAEDQISLPEQVEHSEENPGTLSGEGGEEECWLGEESCGQFSLSLHQ